MLIIEFTDNSKKVNYSITHTHSLILLLLKSRDASASKKKQSEVKVDEKYILPDSPSQKIECRGRGLVFSWVDDLNNITI